MVYYIQHLPILYVRDIPFFRGTKNRYLRTDDSTTNPKCWFWKAFYPYFVISLFIIIITYKKLIKVRKIQTIFLDKLSWEKRRRTCHIEQTFTFSTLSKVNWKSIIKPYRLTPFFVKYV